MANLNGDNRKIYSKNCDEACTEWSCVTSRGGSLYHKSIQQSKSLTVMYDNKWRINETNYVPIASAICGVKTECTRLERKKRVKNLSCYSVPF
jgi:hypothetical protein